MLDFSGTTSFDLSAGTYSFGVIITDDQASWFTSDVSALSQMTGAICNFGQFAADANPTFPPRNNFTGASSILCGSGDTLLFTIGGRFVDPPSQVPLPGAIAFMAAGIASLGGVARRRKSTAAKA